MKTKPMLIAFTLMLALVNTSAQETPAKVTVWAKHFGGQVLYTYDVHNLGTMPIARFRVGEKISPDGMNGEAELTVAPLSTYSTFWLSPEVGQSPEGWGVSVNYPEESSTFSLEWIEASHFRQLWPSAPTNEAPRAVAGVRSIAPRSTLSGFGVALPQEDLAYVGGHASFATAAGFTSVPLTRGDATAPSITLNVNRLNQNETNGAWAIFKVTYDVSDNYDPLPTSDFHLSSSPVAAPGDVVMDKNSAKAWNVKLRNVPGRTYQFRVRSADASGNVATKTYSYSVPATNTR